MLYCASNVKYLLIDHLPDRYWALNGHCVLTVQVEWSFYIISEDFRFDIVEIRLARSQQNRTYYICDVCYNIYMLLYNLWSIET